MTEIKMFYPWKGVRFGDPTNMLDGLRLLIVGESHYPGPNNIDRWVGQSEPEATRETIQKYAIECPYLFFNKLSRLATGEQSASWSNERNSEFWHSVAFYNFVPVFIRPPAQGGRPKAAEWQAGKEPFVRVLTELEPDILIVCGLGLWSWVTDSLPGGAELNSPQRDTAQIGKGLGLRIPHVTGSRGEGKYRYEISRPLFVSIVNERRP